MRQVVDELSAIIEAVYRSRDPRADARLMARFNPTIELFEEVPCQLPRDTVEMMDEIIVSENMDRPARETLYGTSVWARRWLRELYVSRDLIG